MNRSRFGGVALMVVLPGTTFQASNCGFARNCRDMIVTMFPGIDRSIFERPDIMQMMDEVDNVTGAVYILDPVEGQPVMADSTLEGLQKEYEEWLDRI